MAAAPECEGPDNWAASMAFVHMKNAGITTNSEIDFSKTRVTRLASEHTGKDIYRQVHLVVFTKQSGGTIEAITVNDASHSECSESGVEVFVVSQELGDNLLLRLPSH